MILDTTTKYLVQVLFLFGTKPGETEYEKWSDVDVPVSAIEEAQEFASEYRHDGLETRIVKITSFREIV